MKLNLSVKILSNCMKYYCITMLKICDSDNCISDESLIFRSLVISCQVLITVFILEYILLQLQQTEDFCC